MKKLIIILGSIIVVAVVALFSINYYASKSMVDISKLSPEYKLLADDCKETSELLADYSTYNCCMASVEWMAAGNFDLVYLPYPGEENPKPECPEGFIKNTLKCLGSFDWCQPANLDINVNQ